MNKLIEILEDIQPGIDYTTCTDLIDGRRISSLSIISLVVELEDAFDITIPAVEIIPANFNSAQSLWQMMVRLLDEG